MTKLKVTDLPIGSLKPYDRNARTHSAQQIAQIAASIKAFGFNNPVLIDKDGGIIAGHGRVEAAKQLGLENVPCVRLEHLSNAQKRAYKSGNPPLAGIEPVPSDVERAPGVGLKMPEVELLPELHIVGEAMFELIADQVLAVCRPIEARLADEAIARDDAV